MYIIFLYNIRTLYAYYTYLIKIELDKKLILFEFWSGLCESVTLKYDRYFRNLTFNKYIFFPFYMHLILN